MSKHLTKTIAVIAAVCVTAGSMSVQLTYDNAEIASAKTLSEIETEKKEKQALIEEKKAEVAALADDISQKEAYAAALQEEIGLMSDKMFLVDTQVQNINTEIMDTMYEINELQFQIDEQQAEVDEGLETFKARIRALYVYGNDSLLSALVGATDFYDVLTKADLIQRIAKHDDQLIETLRRQIQELDEKQTELNNTVSALNIKQIELTKLREEFNVNLDELNLAVNQSKQEQANLAAQQASANQEIATHEESLEELDEEEEELILAMARKAAEEAAKTATTTTTTTTTKKTTTTTTTTTTKKTTTTTTTTTKKAMTTTTTTTPAPQKTTQATIRTTSGGTTTTTTTTTTAKPTTTTTTTTTTAAPTTTTPAVTTTAAPYNGGLLAWPAPGYYGISSPFGPRWGKIHKGIDIIGTTSAINGANACAAASGKVITAKTGYNGGYGNYVQIDHGNGIVTLYAHLQSLNVSVGQQVSVGQVIGKVGSTGNSTGPHLHFSVIVNGTFVDPKKYLP